MRPMMANASIVASCQSTTSWAMKASFVLCIRRLLPLDRVGRRRASPCLREYVQEALGDHVPREARLAHEFASGLPQRAAALRVAPEVGERCCYRLDLDDLAERAAGLVW